MSKKIVLFINNSDLKKGGKNEIFGGFVRVFRVFGV